MIINKIQNGSSITLSVEGRLDTQTSPELEKILKEICDVKEITLDFKKLDYISSAGLRVLLATHKDLSQKGCLTIINSNEAVLDVFEVTGFMDILNIK